MVPEISSTTDSFCHFGLFFALLSLKKSKSNNPEKKKFKKKKKKKKKKNEIEIVFCLLISK